jgi:hypothetical protein
MLYAQASSSVLAQHVGASGERSAIPNQPSLSATMGGDDDSSFCAALSGDASTAVQGFAVVAQQVGAIDRLPETVRVCSSPTRT